MAKIFKTAIYTGAVVLALSGPALATSCPKHMAAIDAALSKSPKLSAQQLGEVKALRAKGEADHKSGKHAESMESLSKAEKILGTQ